MNQEKLRITRAALRCSQARLSKISGVSLFKINRYELGYIELTKNEVLSLQDAIESIKRNIRIEISSNILGGLDE